LAAVDGELRILVLPLRADAPIHLPADVAPPPGAAPVAELLQVELQAPGLSCL
jgi:hypothetical protein